MVSSVTLSTVFNGAKHKDTNDVLHLNLRFPHVALGYKFVKSCLLLSFQTRFLTLRIYFCTNFTVAF